MTLPDARPSSSMARSGESLGGAFGAQGVAGRPAHWRDAVDLDAPAQPFDKNPSAWKERVPICALAAVGGLVATHMALFQWGLTDFVWDPVFGEGTERVLTSTVSGTMERLLHVPDAALGAFGYFSEAVLGLVGSTRRWQFRPWLVLLFGLLVIPLGFASVALVFMQGLVVGSWCFPCLITAAISVVLVVMAYDEVWASLVYLREVWTRSRDSERVWNVFWGRPVPVSGDPAAFERGGMWGRVSEIGLGLWLAMSPLVFGGKAASPLLAWNAVVCGGVVVALALASYWRPLRHAHLGNLAVAAWLLLFGYFGGGHPAASGYQNLILLGLVLPLFSIIPDNAFDPPLSWREFFQCKAEAALKE